MYALAAQVAKKNNWIKRNYFPRQGSRVARSLYFRIVRPVLRAFYSLYKWRHPDTPWTSPASIAIFEATLTKDMTAFEFGSGASTLFFARRVGRLISLEHDASWYNRVQQNLKAAGVVNTEYRLREPKPEVEDHEEDLVMNGIPMKHTFAGPFRDYSSAIGEFPDEHFDFVLVDGRARVDCIIRSIPKLKKGGILVLDNSERERYRMAFEVLTKWPMIFTTTGVTDTSIWLKPVNSEA